MSEAEAQPPAAPGSAVLHYESPVPFTRRQRFLLWLLPPLLAALLRVTFLWCRRIEHRGRERLDGLIAARQPFVISFWHEAMALSAYAHRGLPAHTLTSYSFDGELAARVVGCFGLRAVRGSSSRGGVKALDQMLKAIAHSPILGITLDGPRGPRREAKLGAVYIAAKTGAVLLPNAYALDRCWRMRSWDRLPIPKPGARIVCVWGEPIPVPADTRRSTLEATRAALENALAELHRQIES